MDDAAQLHAPLRPSLLPDRRVGGCCLLRLLFLMYPDAAALDDPEFAGKLLLRQCSDKRSAKILKFVTRHRLVRPENSNARVSRRPKPQRICKVQIECHDSPVFVYTAFQNTLSDQL